MIKKSSLLNAVIFFLSSITGTAQPLFDSLKHSISEKISYGTNAAQDDCDELSAKITALSEKYTNSGIIMNINDTSATTLGTGFKSHRDIGLIVRSNKQAEKTYNERIKKAAPSINANKPFLDSYKALRRDSEKITPFNAAEIIDLYAQQELYLTPKSERSLKQKWAIKTEDTIDGLEEEIENVRKKMKAAGLPNFDTLNEISQNLASLKSNLTASKTFAKNILLNVCSFVSKNKQNDPFEISDSDEDWLNRIFRFYEKFDEKYNSIKNKRVGSSNNPLTLNLIDACYTNKELKEDDYLSFFTDPETPATAAGTGESSSESTSTTDPKKGALTLDLTTATEYHGLSLTDKDVFVKAVISFESNIRNAIERINTIFPRVDALKDEGKTPSPTNGWPQLVQLGLSSYKDRAYMAGYGVVAARIALQKISEKAQEGITSITDKLQSINSKIKTGTTLPTDLSSSATIINDEENKKPFHALWTHLSPDQKKEVRKTCLKALKLVGLKLYLEYRNLLTNHGPVIVASGEDTPVYQEFKNAQTHFYNMIILVNYAQGKNFPFETAKKAKPGLMNLFDTLEQSAPTTRKPEVISNQNNIKSMKSSYKEAQQAATDELSQSFDIASDDPTIRTQQLYLVLKAIAANIKILITTDTKQLLTETQSNNLLALAQSLGQYKTAREDDNIYTIIDDIALLNTLYVLTDQYQEDQLTMRKAGSYNAVKKDAADQRSLRNDFVALLRNTIITTLAYAKRDNGSELVQKLFVDANSLIRRMKKPQGTRLSTAQNIMRGGMSDDYALRDAKKAKAAYQTSNSRVSNTTEINYDLTPDSENNSYPEFSNVSIKLDGDPAPNFFEHNNNNQSQGFKMFYLKESDLLSNAEKTTMIEVIVKDNTKKMKGFLTKLKDPALSTLTLVSSDERFEIDDVNDYIFYHANPTSQNASTNIESANFNETEFARQFPTININGDQTTSQSSFENAAVNTRREERTSYKPMQVKSATMSPHSTGNSATGQSSSETEDSDPYDNAQASGEQTGEAQAVAGSSTNTSAAPATYDFIEQTTNSDKTTIPNITVTVDGKPATEEFMTGITYGVAANAGSKKIFYIRQSDRKMVITNNNNTECQGIINTQQILTLKTNTTLFATRNYEGNHSFTPYTAQPSSSS